MAIRPAAGHNFYRAIHPALPQCLHGSIQKYIYHIQLDSKHSPSPAVRMLQLATLQLLMFNND